MNTLNIKALLGLLCLFVAYAALLFIPVRTFDYWQAWAFLSVYFTISLVTTFYLMTKDRKLLARRMSAGPTAEKSLTQKILISVTSLGFPGLIAFSACDHRLAWSHVPAYVALVGDGLVAIGRGRIFAVFRENTFASSTVELATDQKVISTGSYARVRHPMYAGVLIMFLGVPIALGSWWGLLFAVATMPPLIWRLFDEEKFLVGNLPGYAAYQKTVPYRLIPRVW